MNPGTMSWRAVLRGDFGQGVILTAGTGVSALLAVAYMSYAGRQLGAAASSDFYAAIFSFFWIIPLSAPLNAALTRFVAQYVERGQIGRIRELYWWTMRAVLMVAAGIALLVGLTLDPAVRLFGFRTGAPLLLAALIGALYGLANVGRAVMRGHQRYAAYSLSVAAESLLRLVIGVGLLHTFSKVSANISLWPYVAAGLLALCLTQWQIRADVGLVPKPNGRPTDASAMLLFSAPMFVLAAADAAFLNFDVLLVKARFAAEDSGAYGAVGTVTRGLGVLVSPFLVMALPRLTAVVERGEPSGGILLRLCSTFFAIAILPLLIFAIAGQWLMAVIFGEEFAAAGALLLPHGLGIFFGYLSILIAQGFCALSNFRFLKFYVLGFAIEVVALTVVPGDLHQVSWTLAAVKGVILTTMIALFARYAKDCNS